MSAPAYAFVVYRDKDKQHRWRLMAPNGRIVADSGEGYTRRTGVVAAVGRIQKAQLIIVPEPGKRAITRRRKT